MLTRPAPDDPFSSFALAGERTIGVAVSGGGDSIALLSMLGRHLAALADPPRLIVLTVDHGLRPGSAGEAAGVAALSARLGHACRVLEWRGPHPAHGLAEAARLARYRLLSAAAVDAGAGLVLTGHTADDQAETVAMRAARGSGPGLAGLAPATLHGGRVWFARPLLGWRRADLRAVLARAGITHVDDPTNDDLRTERARVRAALAARPDDLAAWLDRQARTEGGRCAVLAEAAGRVEHHAAMPEPGLFRLDRSLFDGSAAATEAFRHVVALAGGQARAPDLARTADLCARLAAAPAGHRLTFSGAVVTVRRDGIDLHREWRGTGPAAGPVSAGMIWDGRFQVIEADDSARIGAVGGARRGAARAEPLVTGGRAVLSRVVSPFAAFLPSFDLPLAQALARLAGARRFPASPHLGRNEGATS